MIFPLSSNKIKCNIFLGCGILEFATEELAKAAVDKMHRHELRGRKLVVKEDFDTERDRYVFSL